MDIQAVQPERLSKQFWAIDDTAWEVRRVTGYECPNNDGVWWVPLLGYSMTEGYHLFGDFETAKTTALKKLSMNITTLKNAYNRLLEAGPRQ